MHKRSERVESPGTYVTELVSHGHFYLALCSDHPPILWWFNLERGGMQLHDVVGINSKKGQITENQCTNIKYMG